MIEIKLNSQPVNSFDEFSDLRIAETELINKSPVAQNYHLQFVPALPRWTDKEYKSGNEIVNLYQLYCTCETHSLRRELITEVRDIRRLCKHIYSKLEQTADRTGIDSLTLLFCKSAAIFGERFLFKYNIKKEDIYFGFTPSAEWINIYTKNVAGDYLKYAYQPIWNRWAYGNVPIHSHYILYTLEALLKYQLPFTHSWVVVNEIQKKSVSRS